MANFAKNKSEETYKSTMNIPLPELLRNLLMNVWQMPVMAHLASICER